MFRVACLGMVLAVVGSATADPLPASVRSHAVRRSGDITIDGHLDEPAWKTAPRQTGFIQHQPKDGVKANQETSFAVLYDDAALYVGVWLDDPHPEEIRALLTRRDVDTPAADAVMVGIDSYHDRRTAYVFQLNAAGVQRDMLLFDDTNGDDTWDAVWTGNSIVTDKGWTAEFRIPLNQLRFSTNEAHEWGLQVVRWVGRSQEQSSWSPWPRSGPEVVSKFGVVDGIDHLQPSRRLELLPYVTGGFDVAPIDAGDPLNDHLSMRRNIGLDLKYGLGPAFTLSATINPDFGQVEADPSQITLGPFELFYPEKRPFFLEGIDLFKLPVGQNDNSVEGAFYSRRIGAAPPNEPDSYNYINWPTSTTIYSAMKLTGKTTGGWSVGVLDAVTGETTASIIDGDNMRSDPVVAPLTNYAVARLKRDLNNGNTAIGISATAVDRDIHGTPLADTLRDQAYTGGFQFLHKSDDGAWTANAHGVGSWVHGTPAAMADLQQDPNHLFQRPDSADSHFDPMRTSMPGYGLSWSAGRNGNTKHWRFFTGGDIRSPGLELNDLGFQTGGDRILSFAGGQYHDETPGDYVLNWQVNTDVFEVATLEPVLDDVGYELNPSVQFNNYWQMGGYLNIDRARWNQVALRGGPALRVDPQYQGNVFVTTDTRKPVWFNFFINGYRAPESDLMGGSGEVDVTVQARSNIDISAGFNLSQRDDPMQYVTEVDDQMNLPHYIFAHVKQTTASLTMRMNWTFSPKLALQIYAQPFIAAGRYAEYKDVNNPHADRFSDRFHQFAGTEYAIDNDQGVVSVASNGASYKFDKPDFDFRQLRSTVVFRWEYRPGSTLFAIWSHGQTNSIDDGRFRLGRDFTDLLSSDSEDVVMVKLNYWVGL